MNGPGIKGVAETELDGYEFNTKARRLYEHLGYRTMRLRLLQAHHARRRQAPGLRRNIHQDDFDFGDVGGQVVGSEGEVDFDAGDAGLRVEVGEGGG